MSQKPWHKRLRDKVGEAVDVDRVLHGAKSALEVGSDAAEILVEMGNGVTVPGAAALTLRGVNSIRRIRSRSPSRYFSDGYKPLSLRGMGSILHAAFAAQPELDPHPVPGTHDESPAYTAVLDGIEFGWAVSALPRIGSRGSIAEDDQVRGAWIRIEQDELDAIQILGRCIWKHLGSLSLLMRPSRGEALTVVAEPPREILPSRTGDELYEKLRRSLDRGIHRSVFLIGEPGVGKSCMLRYVASLHKGLQLRFKLGDMHSMDASTIADVVEVLRPDVLLIDDFDRLVGSRKDPDKAVTMLDPLETINELVPLFFVSANYNENITPAILRPGRFDEMIVMDSLEPELYEKMLPGAPAKLIKSVRRARMPMAHVVELQKRARALDWDWVKAKKEVRELAQRSNRLVDLNERSIRRRGRKPAKLAGKSQRQKAVLLDNQATSCEKKAESYRRRIERLTKQAEKKRASAEGWRQKAARAESDAKEKAAKKTAKKAAKKKATKRAKKKKVIKKGDEDPSALRPVTQRPTHLAKRHARPPNAQSRRSKARRRKS